MERDLTDIARRGLDAAGALVDRFADVVETTDSSADPIEAVGQAWGAVLRTTATAWSGGADGAGSTSSEGPLLDLAVSGGLVVPVVVADGTGRAEFWLHNPTAEPLERVGFAPGPLRAALGVADGARLRLEPEEVSPVPARSSKGIGVTVEVPHATAGDRLRSLVLLDGVFDVWALIDVTVA